MGIDPVPADSIRSLPGQAANGHDLLLRDRLGLGRSTAHENLDPATWLPPSDVRNAMALATRFGGLARRRLTDGKVVGRE